MAEETPDYGDKVFDILGALADSLEAKYPQVAVELDAAILRLRSVQAGQVILADQAAEMARAWDKVTAAVRAELSVVHLQHANDMVRSRAATVLQALENASWLDDLARVVETEGRALGDLAKNAGSLVTGLELLVKASIPDVSSYEMAKVGFGGLVGVIGGAILIGTGLPVLAIGALSFGLTLLADQVFTDYIAPAFGLDENTSDTFRNDVLRTIEILTAREVKVTDPVYALDILRKAILNRADATPPDDVYAFSAGMFQVTQELKRTQTYNVKVVRLFDMSPAQLAQAASGADSEGMAYRYALRELHAVAVVGISYSPHNQDGSLNLSDGASAGASTGMSAEYIADRSTMLYWAIQRNLVNSDVIAAGPYVRGLHFRDVAANLEFDLGLPSPAKRQMQFISGAAGDTLTGQRLEDRLYGGGGDDTLSGEAGKDFLEGNAGVDTLKGGDGNDQLVGGTGRDVYEFTGVFGNDTIRDADDDGEIKIDGSTLTGAGEIETTASQNQPYTIWTDEDHAAGKITYRLDTVQKTLLIKSSNGTITIHDFESGSLGIEVPEAEEPEEPPQRTTYDLAIEEDLDAYRNAQTAQSTANLHIKNAAAIVQTYLGQSYNVISARTGSGEDLIEGGVIPAVSRIRMSAGAGDDEIYAGIKTELDEAIARGEAEGVVVPEKSFTILDGEAGDDTIVGSDASDVLLGGEGSDTIVGGHGVDVIFADGIAGGMQEGGLSSLESYDLKIPLIQGQNNAASGETASVAIYHAGVLLGGPPGSGVNAPGEMWNITWLDPFRNFDFSQLEQFTGQDIRGQGYTSLSGVELTADQPLGASVKYTGSGRAFQSNLGEGDDLIFAGAGDDVVNAGAGDDVVIAGSGSDIVAGFEGDDYIEGGDGGDRLYGDLNVAVGPDEYEEVTTDIYGKHLVLKTILAAEDHGRDYIDGGKGDDYVFGGGLDDEVFGGDGKDWLFGDDVKLRGQYAGDDYVDGEDGEDFVFGGAGNDQLEGGEDDSADVLVGDMLEDDGAERTSDYLNGGGGADQLLGGTGDDELYGGAGADVLRGDGTVSDADPTLRAFSGIGSVLTSTAVGDDYLNGGDGADWLFGDGGNDVLVGGRGSDSLWGGAGDDTYIFSAGDADFDWGQDEVNDSEGSNTAAFHGVSAEDLQLSVLESDPNALVIRYDKATDIGDASVVLRGAFDGRGVQSIRVNSQSQSLRSFVAEHLRQDRSVTVTEDSGVAFGGAGNDTINMYGSFGEIDGGRGNDRINASGERNAIILNRGSGNDVVEGATLGTYYSNNILQLEDGLTLADIEIGRGAQGGVLLTVKNGNASALMQGGVGSVRFGANGPEIALSEVVRLSLLSKPTAADDLIEGSVFSDDIAGGASNDSLIGYEGNDTLRADGGNDLLIGGEGNDTYIVAAGAQATLVHGLGEVQEAWTYGYDKVILPGSAETATWTGVVEDRSLVLTVDPGNGEPASTVRLVGFFDRGERSRAWSAATLEFAGGGSLTRAQITALVSQSTEGNDAIEGSDENDTLLGLGGDDILSGMGGADTLAGGAGNDDIDGGWGEDTISGGDGNDRIVGGSEADVLAGDAGADVLAGESGNDQLDGGLDDDVLDGGDGADALEGGEGNDLLIGGSGNDTLRGGAGSDRLDGGSGADTLEGGQGDDIYVIHTQGTEANAPGAQDVVSDVDGADLIVLEDVDASALVRVKLEGGDWQLMWQGGSLRVQGGADALTRMSVQAGATTLLLGDVTDASEPDQPTGPETNADYLARHAASAKSQIKIAGLQGALAWRFASHESLGEQLKLISDDAAQADYSVSAYQQSYQPYTYTFSGYRDSNGNVYSSRYRTETQSTLEPVYRLPTQLPAGATGTFVERTWVTTTRTNLAYAGNLEYFTEQRVSFNFVRTFDAAAASVDATLGGSDNEFTFSAGLARGGEGNDVLRANIASFSRQQYVLEFGWLDWDVQAQRVAMLSRRNLALLTGETTATWMDGGDGNDHLIGSEVSDTLYGGRGVNLLEGGEGPDRYLVLNEENDEAGYDVIKDLTRTVPLVNEGYPWYGDLPAEIVPAGADIDTVEFGPGINLSDITGTLVQAAGEEPMMLSLSAAGRRLADIAITQEQLARVATDDRGIEFFQFQDGQRISMAQMLSHVSVPYAPLVATPLPDAQDDDVGEFVYSIPAGTFADAVDPTLLLTAALADGSALPAWLQLVQMEVEGVSTWRLQGTPPTGAANFDVRITATNDAGLSVSDVLEVTLTHANNAPQVGEALTQQTVGANQSLSWVVPEGAFADIDAGDTLTWSFTPADWQSGWLQFDPATRTLYGTPGLDRMYSGAWGTITVTDSSGATASQEVSIFVGEPTGVQLQGTEADEVLSGTMYADDIAGGGGSDSLVGDGGDDTLRADAGADLLVGGEGSDTYVISPGTDATIVHGLGMPLEAWNYGYDRLVLPGSAESATWTGTVENGSLVMTVNPGNGQPTATVRLVGYFDGGQWAQAWSNASIEFAGGGILSRAQIVAEVRQFTAGDDVIHGSNGDDVLDGSDGDDRLDGEGGADTLQGGSGNDDIKGGWGEDTISGGDGDDYLEGGTEDDLLMGDAGSDVLVGWADNDTLRGGSGDDLLDGEDGNDILEGDDGADHLIGGDGNDTLRGGVGADTLEGGAGMDVLEGGEGNDVYVVYSRGDNADLINRQDLIADTEGNDLIRLEGMDAGSLLRLKQDDGTWRLIWDGGSLRVQGGADALTRISVRAGSTTTLLGDIEEVILSNTPGGAENNGDYLARRRSAVRTQIDMAGRLGTLAWRREGLLTTEKLKAIATDAAAADYSISEYEETYRPYTYTFSGYRDSAGNVYSSRYREETFSYTQWVVNAFGGGGAGGSVLQSFEATGSRLVYIPDLEYFIEERVSYETVRTFISAPVSADAVLGDSSNAFTFTSGLVSGGAGDDVLTANIGTFSRYQYVMEYEWQFLDVIGPRVSALSYRNDLLLSGRVSATWMDGGDGNDHLIGSEVADTLYGGRGVNLLEGGEGPDRYLVLAEENDEGGYDVIRDVARSAPLVNPYYSPSQTWYGDLPEEIIPPGADIDTVEFGPGISLAQVTGTIIQATEGDPAMLSLSAGGKRLADIALTQEQLDGTATFDRGIEYFEFQDGQRISMAQMLSHVNGPTGPSVAVPLADVQDDDSGQFVYTIPTGTFTDATDPTLALTATLADGSALPAWLQLVQVDVDGVSTWRLQGTPPSGAAAFEVRVTATNDAGQSTSDVLAVTLTHVNNAPAAQEVLTPQTAVENESFSWVLPEGAFTDVDAGDALTWTFTPADSQSAWLQFDPVTRTLSGTPGHALLNTTARGTITVTDPYGATASQEVAINVAEPGGLTLLGTQADDLLTGTIGTDAINGDLGADTMRGGKGSDTYYVDNALDVVTERLNEGIDTVVASTTWTMSANVENLTLAEGAVDGTGNSLANVITGNAAANRLAGGAGADTLLGAGGDDWLRGGVGADRMEGGAGSDLYEVDDAGDQVIEQVNQGYDTVESSVSWTLGANAEALILTGTGAVDGTGNAQSNLLQGNGAANTLTGGDGNDMLNGRLGVDTLIGGTGNDTYLFEDDLDIVVEEAGPAGGRDVIQSRFSLTLADNVEDGVLTGSATHLTGNSLSNVLTGNAVANVIDGGAGADVLIGGRGNDRYIVGEQADTVVEQAGEGADTIEASVNYTLGANVEHLVLTGNAQAGMGNALNNKLTGNAGANTLFGQEGNDELDGGAGADVMIGGVGNDRYHVDSSDDLVVEQAGEGTDTVYASVSHALADNVENLVLTGTGNINAVGNAGNNRLQGNAGNNVLFGGLGNDTYVFGRGSGQDMVANFDAGKPSGDRVLLEAGIVVADLSFNRVGQDLVLQVRDTSDQLTVVDYFVNGGRGPAGLERIRFADGTALDHAGVLALLEGTQEAPLEPVLPEAVRLGDPTSLYTAPAPAATAPDVPEGQAPQSVAEAIALAKARFEQGLEHLRLNTAEQGGMDRGEFVARRTLPLLWNLQDALLDLQLAKNAEGRFTGSVSVDSRMASQLGSAAGALGGLPTATGQLGQVARPEQVQQFDLAQLG